MGVFDKVRELAEHLTEPDSGPAVGSPAAAGSEGTVPHGEPGEVSEAGSGFSDPQTSEGGADAVPGTPDATPSTGLGSGAEVD